MRNKMIVVLALLTMGLFAVACDSPTDPQVNAAFTWSSNGLLVQFLNQTTPEGKSWRWTFGDATSASHQRDPIHEYAADGQYRVDLRSCSKQDLTGNCSDSSGFVTVP